MKINTRLKKIVKMSSIPQRTTFLDSILFVSEIIHLKKKLSKGWRAWVMGLNFITIEPLIKKWIAIRKIKLNTFTNLKLLNGYIVRNFLSMLTINLNRQELWLTHLCVTLWTLQKRLFMTRLPLLSTTASKIVNSQLTMSHIINHKWSLIRPKN